MALSAVLIVHIAAGATGLATGGAALVARKGERLHRAVGTVFFVSMLTMAAVGTAIAVGMREPLAFVPGLVTFYLTVTAWAAVRRGEGRIGWFESGAALAGVLIAATGLGLAGTGGSQGGILLGFAALAGFAAWQDVRIIRAGGVAGSDRIRRHLWRMCAALTIAAFSFFLGQQDEFPKAMQGPQNAIPPLAVLATMIFWLVRLRRPSQRPAARARQAA
jgi:uncharacterized membrane protein